MEETSCIPAYKNINTDELYRQQEDYAFVNDIIAKPFFYDPYFKQEHIGPYIKEYYQSYKSNTTMKNSVYSPVIMSQQKLNKQCNPFVSYPYGVPVGVEYQICSKCKCKKSNRNKKNENKKDQNAQTSKKSFENNSILLVSNSYDENISNTHTYVNKESCFDTFDEISITKFSMESDDMIPLEINNHEKLLSNNLETIYLGECKESKDQKKFLDAHDERTVKKNDNLFEICDHDYKLKYYPSNNENGYTLPKEEIEIDYRKEIIKYNNVHFNSNEHNKYSPNEKYFNTDTSNLERYSFPYTPENRNAKQQNDTQKSINEKYIGKHNDSEKIHQINDEKVKNKKSKECEIIKKNRDNIDDDTNENFSSEQIKTPNTKETSTKNNLKQGGNSKYSTKQVKICEDENILNKYSVMNSLKKKTVSKESLKEKPIQKISHDIQENEINENVEYYGRACKFNNSKNELPKKGVITIKKGKVGHNNNEDISLMNENYNKYSHSSSKKMAKHRKSFIEKDNTTIKKKGDKKELNYGRSKLAISRTKSLKVKRGGTISFPPKNYNLFQKKKSILNKQKSMIETQFKKQNTMSLKRKKTLSKLNPTKQPYKIFLNKKKVICTQKSLHGLDNKKNKNLEPNSKKMLSRSKTKVYVDNDTKVFKKVDVKMVSKNIFNPNLSIESYNNNETDNKKGDTAVSQNTLNDELDNNLNKVDSISSKNKGENEIVKKKLDNSNANKMGNISMRNRLDTNSIRNKVKNKKKELFDNIISLTKNMKYQPLKKKYNNKIDPSDLLSIESNNSSDAHF
ncbi:conserved Plasmodium protein, unknown function [Plasmodium berghei]|uniref:Uncharacterized protein n=2 Tax=Plasmodium berghei TaxID=5821 RepID=A0A509AHM9_PLABA|nr:conserved Plasmodium protein, unknown function [Plasmodium berghei ANKA]CXI23835.1 conserved Plasmodium protein, unknown function [Plasmodium berghei]SCM20234.1 conserved Plasmodium protein, unknown function [Plasmodium berghei]SCN23858.1 conserved Plasmodium protein, unknown function [Plasmodium berghei]SCO59274.1 conserved Plasmodium protein, unknown function [Plasmodium berghei]SCO60263.1 conserved Plasmodium protein, unknown function [Plasmodium berghei]|eukprot:XP_034420812.1 conserved Plasmodium protein, unknown function [Plasmodium berghei ANKA]